jgi:hypothetical protein
VRLRILKIAEIRAMFYAMQKHKPDYFALNNLGLGPPGPEISSGPGSCSGVVNPESLIS